MLEWMNIPVAGVRVQVRIVLTGGGELFSGRRPRYRSGLRHDVLLEGRRRTHFTDLSVPGIRRVWCGAVAIVVVIAAVADDRCRGAGIRAALTIL